MTDVARDTQPEGSKPSRRDWGALATLAAGLGLIVLDGTIVSVSLPVMIPDLGMSLSEAEWVNSLYAVVVAGLLLGTGALADRSGRRKLFLAGIVIFVVGSALAGAATNPALLLSSRAIQAVGAAAIMPATLSSVNAMFRGKWRAAAFGIWGAVISGAAAVGPLAGGALTEWVSWRWIFYVNLPLGAILIIAALMVVPETYGQRTRGFDYLGLVLSAVGLALLVFAVIEGPQTGWWKPIKPFEIGSLSWSESAPVSIVTVALGVSVLTLTAFFMWEKRSSDMGRPTILDVNLFKLGTFTWGNLTAATVAIGEFSLLFVLPLFLVNILGLTTISAGVVLAGMAGGAFLAGASARHIAGAIGAAGTVILGLSLEIAGALALAALLHVDSSSWTVALPLVVYGLGLGLASAQLTSLVLRDVPVKQSGQGSAAQSTIRQVGAALGTAFAGTTLSISLGKILPKKLESIGLVGEQANELADTTITSAGSIIPILYGKSPEMATALQTLSEGFTQGTRISLLVSTAFLAIGLLGAIRVRKAALQLS